MDRLVITGARPYDGTYEFDWGQLTAREWGWLKRFAGVMPVGFEDAIRGGDAEMIVTLAVVALHRAGKIQTAEVPDIYERLADIGFMEDLQIRLEIGDRESEDDAGPPPANSSSSNGSSSPSGRTSSEESPTIPAGTGVPLSATSASGPRTSEN
jgi:hypothetical protein